MFVLIHESQIAISRLCRMINMIIIVCGLIGNSLSILVFARKPLQKYSVSVFTILLAVADNLEILSIVLTNWIDLSDGTEDFMNKNALWCHFQSYIDMFFNALSSWTVVAVSAERWVCVYMPFQKSSIFKLKNTLIVITCYTSIATLAFMWFPFTVKFEKNHNGSTSCVLHNESLYKIMGAFDVILIYIAPFIILGILNSMILFRLNKQRNNIRKRLSEANINGLSGSRSRNNDMVVNVMLLSVAISFMMFIFPFQINWFFNQYVSAMGMDEKYRNTEEIRYQITFSIRNINYMINFILYSATSSLFRRELTNAFITRLISKLRK
ncbi:hypothetical protein ACOME3_003384 [Neoechinorhynchus agilis]